MKRLFLVLLSLAVLSLSVPAQQAVPRAEYPQPQFQRDAWLNLNGAWEFEFDDANAGLDQGLGRRDAARSAGRSRCRSASRAALSGIGDTLLSPVGLVPAARSRCPPTGRASACCCTSAPSTTGRTVWVNGHVRRRARGRQRAVLVRHHAAAQARRERRSRCARRIRPTDRSIPRGKQYWEAGIARHLLHAHERHLADGVAGGGGRELSRERAHHPVARRHRAVRRPPGEAPAGARVRRAACDGRTR